MGGNRVCCLAVMLLVCVFNLGCCVTVEFFSGPDYSGLLESKTVDPAEENKCIRLDNFYEFQSIKTDRCLLIYETADCSDLTRIGKQSDNPKATLYSYRIPNNTDRFNKEDSLAYKRFRPDGITRGVQSFHVCSRNLGGGSKLDVDLFNSALYNPLLKSWRGVCKCETLPGPYVYKEREQMSINNHGNNLYIYSEAKCQGTGRFIPAGDSDHSRVIYNNGRQDLIRSFRPADSLDCIE